MKRTPALLLAFLLLLSIFASAFAETHIGEEYQRTLWDIPWGVSRDEFRTLAEANTGIQFELDEPNTPEDRLSLGIRSVEGQNIFILGQPSLGISGAFTWEINTLSGININFANTRKEYLLADCAAIMNSLYASLLDQYGTPTGGFLHLKQPHSTEMIEYALPPTLTQEYETFLFMHIQTNRYMNVTVYFGNVELTLCCYEKKDDNRLGQVIPLINLFCSFLTEERVQEQISRYKDLPIYGAEEAQTTSTPVIDIGL